MERFHFCDSFAVGDSSGCGSSGCGSSGCGRYSGPFWPQAASMQRHRNRRKNRMIDPDFFDEAVQYTVARINQLMSLNRIRNE